MRSGWIALSLWLLIIIGWFMNLYKLTKYDFDTPLKAEATRIVGMVVFPLGAVMGYLDIEDDNVHTEDIR
jgi:hypothetical protein